MEPGKEGHFIVKKLRLPWFRLCLPPGFCRSLGHTLGFALALRNSSTPPPPTPQGQSTEFSPKPKPKPTKSRKTHRKAAYRGVPGEVHRRGRSCALPSLLRVSGLKSSWGVLNKSRTLLRGPSGLLPERTQESTP